MKNLKCRSNMRPFFWKVRILFWKVRPLFWKVRPLFLKCETAFFNFVTNFDFALSDTNSKMCDHKHFGHFIKIPVSHFKKRGSHILKKPPHIIRIAIYFKVIIYFLKLAFSITTILIYFWLFDKYPGRFRI